MLPLSGFLSIPLVTVGPLSLPQSLFSVFFPEGSFHAMHPHTHHSVAHMYILLALC